MANAILTAAQVRALLDYNPETGELTWLPRPKTPGSNRAVGQATYICRQGYVKVNINGRLYRGHRLAWVHYYGEWPESNLDHINRDRADNRIKNLRLATPAENMQNQSLRCDNKSGHKGVFWHKAISKWWAYINVGHKRHTIGYFSDLQEAVTARRQAENQLHTHMTLTC